MAFIPQTNYPGRVTTGDPGYPYGKAQNITSPSDGTGTPWEQATINDGWGFHQAILTDAGITPSGTPETATASQYLDGLKKIFPPLNLASFGRMGVQYVAHRGLSRMAPENTIPAYEAAGKAGFWGAECDVQLSQDKVWVLMHDDTVDRTTNGSGTVDSKTLTQLKALDAGGTRNGSPIFDSYFQGTKIPTLKEYLTTCRHYGMVPVIEIKASAAYSDVEIQDLIDTCRGVFTDNQFVVISFSLSVLQQIRSLDQFVEMQLVTGSYSESLVDTCAGLGRCWIDVGFGALPANLDYATERGVLVNTYTLNDADQVRSALELGVRQVTTDYINLP